MRSETNDINITQRKPLTEKAYLNLFSQEHDCKLTQEIIELIDREADLLMRGVKEGNLTGLRKRISTLFLQYTKTPTFNPEAAKLLKVIFFSASFHFVFDFVLEKAFVLFVLYCSFNNQ